MSKKAPQTQNEQKRTTVVVAVGTFIALSLISLVAWAIARPKTAEPVAQQAAAAPAATATPAAEHQHVEGEFERITIDELKPLIDKGDVTVIDVRSMEQYLAAHIPGSLHIPVARVEGEVPYLPKDKLIVTYCTCPAEESSGEAALILAHAGIKAKALKGGLEAWTGLGYPTDAKVQ
jgi:rhodanese-related sulfurtransferase